MGKKTLINRSCFLDRTFYHLLLFTGKRVKIYLNKKGTEFAFLINGLRFKKYHNQGIEQNQDITIFH